MISKEDRCGNLIFVTVSDIGSNHRILCIPNQDFAAFNCVGEDFVLAVSDGVGSCKMAEKGSAYAADACLKLFDSIRTRKISFDKDSLAEELISIWQYLITDKQYDDYCATVKAVFKIGHQIKIISLGDGLAAVSSDGIHMLSPSVEKTFVNETKCLSAHVTAEDFWIGNFRLDTYKPYVVFCCTDGVADGIVQGKELNMIEDIEKNISAAELRSELESLLGEVGNYCFDDKTVGVVKYEGKN